MKKSNKKGMRVWIGILIVLILIGIGAGIYFWFFTGKESMPKKIGVYALDPESIRSNSECIPELINNEKVCFESTRYEYLPSTNLYIYVIPIKVTSGKNAYLNYIRHHISGSNMEGVSGVYRGNEPWEIYWLTDKNYDIMGIQFPSNYNGEVVNATTNNAVVQWMLKHYPPINSEE